jgi:hypothetical protein
MTTEDAHHEHRQHDDTLDDEPDRVTRSPMHWDRRETTAGWWRAEPGWVTTVAAEPVCPAPQRVRSAPGEPGPQ